MGFHVFDNDTRILALSPHMHVRGKAMKYELVLPDGKRQALLDVPLYNYNYQWLYYPTEPLRAPAGSRLEVTATWDNSEGNKANPDPKAEIVYRGDTFNEMFVGFLEAYEDKGIYLNPKPPIEKLTQLMRTHPAGDSWLSAGMLPLGFYVPQAGQRLDLRRQRRQHDHHHARRHPLEGRRASRSTPRSRPPTPTGSRP